VRLEPPPPRKTTAGGGPIQILRDVNRVNTLSPLGMVISSGALKTPCMIRARASVGVLASRVPSAGIWGVVGVSWCDAVFRGGGGWGFSIFALALFFVALQTWSPGWACWGAGGEGWGRGGAGIGGGGERGLGVVRGGRLGDYVGGI